MTPRRYGWLAARQWLSRHQGLLGLLSFSLAVAVAVGGLAGQMAQGYLDDLGDDSDAAIVEVSGVNDRGDARPLDADAVAEMEDVPGVVDVLPWAQVGVSLSPADEVPQDLLGVALWATPRLPMIQPEATDATGADLEEVPDNGVILPAELNGVDTQELVGSTLEFEATRKTGPNEGTGVAVELEVLGTYSGQSGFDDGQTAIYVSMDQMTALLGMAQSGQEPTDDGVVPVNDWPVVYVQAESVDSSSDVAATLRDQGFTADSLADRMQSLPTLVQALHLVSWALLAGVALLLMVTMSTVAGSWLDSRRQEFGMLRAVGWSQAELRRALVWQLVIVGLLLGVLGLLVGTALAWLIQLLPLGGSASLLAASEGPPVPLFYLLLPVAAGVLAVVGAWRGVRRLVRVPAAELLKGM